MRDESKISIYHKLLLVVLAAYAARTLYFLLKNKNNIIGKLKSSLLKTKIIEYLFLFVSLGLLGADYYSNNNLTHHEKRGIYHIVHLSILVTLTALFAHLDLYVIPAMIGLILWVISR